MRTCLVVLLSIVLCGCASTKSLREKKTPDQRRAEIRSEHSEILKRIYAEEPELEAKVAKAPGYATFSAVNINVLVLATARGDGMVVDTRTGKETFMRVAAVGGGIGAGIKDLRALFIFNDRGTVQQFMDSGWQFGAQADASLKSGDKGAAYGESVSVAEGKDGGIDTGVSAGVAKATQSKTAIEIYKITEAGISLQATIAGTKYWKDEELNP